MGDGGGTIVLLALVQFGLKIFSRCRLIIITFRIRDLPNDIFYSTDNVLRPLNDYFVRSSTPKANIFALTYILFVAWRSSSSDRKQISEIQFIKINPPSTDRLFKGTTDDGLTVLLHIQHVS